MMKLHHHLYILALLIALTGCTMSKTVTKPSICLKVNESDIKHRPSAFEPLTLRERETTWGVELLVGQRFARTLDLYRAITAFKRALFLIPPEKGDRRLQIEYSIVESYYLAGKYCDALAAFDASSLNSVNPQEFPPFRDLLIMIHDCYDKVCEYDKAEQVLKIIEHGDSELANDIQLSIAITEGDISSTRALAAISKKREPVMDFLNQYCCCSKSPRKAQMLNAFLPGAGYYYTGQRRAAKTSFLINALFTAATVIFFKQKNYAAGLITLSLESGWYLGGINGAGLAAKDWNEHVYNNLGKGMMIRNELFPFLMLETTF
jgi:tetratricopeptide (TPR) repeat protein